MSTETGVRPGAARSLAHRLVGDRSLRDEGRLGSFDRATGWLGSEPLSANAVRGRVVLVDFWTYTCVNWLRTAPYLRAWHAKYAEAGLTIVGVHTPEFSFESDRNNVSARVRGLDVEYPVAVDDDYGVWNEFANHYWPAIYLADANGRVRFHHFGEGEYAMTEMAIQQLLVENGATDLDLDLVSVVPEGLEVAADWESLRSPESYTGYAQSNGFRGEDPDFYDRSHVYQAGHPLRRNAWDLSGDWTVGREAAVSNAPGGTISFAFHARDANLVMGPPSGSSGIPFRVTIDGLPPGHDAGTDIDGDGRGTLARHDTFQLVRQGGPITDRVLAVEFLEGGAEVYCFTFG